jgi:O-acetyl-ADP-ribose deacetylase (regulator of RNase III)
LQLSAAAQIGYNLQQILKRPKLEDAMLFDDDPRDARKKRFIERIRRRKSGELLSPLAEKIAAWESGELDPASVFKAAGYAARKGEAIIADFKKRPDVILAGIAMDENRIATALGDIGIEVRLVDITDVFSDAIVTPVEPDGSMTSGAAAAVKESGGTSIEEEAREKAPIPAGNAISTRPGDLATGHIIHAAVRDVSGEITASSVTGALSAALKVAEELEAESVVVPGLGYVDGGISAEESAQAVVAAIAGHSGESVTKVLLVDISGEVVDAFVAELEKREEE